MRSSLSLLLASAAVLPIVAPAAAHAEPYRFHDDHVLGTSLDVVAMATDEASARAAARAARKEIDRLDGLLSAWRPDSELERLNRTAALPVSPELFEVLARCEALRGTTGGAFDCRAGGVLALWRQTQAIGGVADAILLERALASARQPVRMENETRIVHRPNGLRFTLDGMAKGYVIDKALAAARGAGPGVTGLMIDIGGDLRCWGQAPQATGWRVGVATVGEADNMAPTSTVRLRDGALAVSGRGARDLTIDGARLSHTLAPSTGRPVAHIRGAAVTARSAADADALATAFMVMAPDRAIALADRTDGVEALVTTHDGVRHASRGWAEMEAPMLIRASYPGAAIAAAAPAVAANAVGLEMTYTVPKLEVDPYHAPYVVAWITDENRQMVRTLLVLGVKPKWAPENFVWWRRYGRLEPQVLDTVGRPTRPPGKYGARWDGKDEAGKPVPPGKYILHIESSREKGGHTYQTVDLDLGGAGGVKALPAKDEIGAVDLRFGPGA
jgi:thiamine biosynthesis lipoprotein